MSHEFEGTLILLGGYFVILPIALLAVAVLLRAGSKWVAGLDVPFGSAYVTALLCGLANLGVIKLLEHMVGLALSAPSDSELTRTVANAVSIPVGLLVQAGIISARQRVRFGRAILISLVMLLIAAVIAAVVAAVVLGVMFATR
jgi:hypothetical protein